MCVTPILNSAVCESGTQDLLKY